MSAVRGLSALSAVLVVGVFVALMGGRTPAFEVGSVADQVSAAIKAKADPAPLHLLAERTVDRLLVFRTSDGPASMTLGSDEVTALINETLPGLLPAGVDYVDIVVRNGGILLRAQVLTDDWVGAQRLRSVMAVLPDILHAEVDGNLVRIGRRLRLQVSSARVNGVWLPGPIVDALLGELPMSVMQADGPILQVTLPDGIDDVRVVGDQLVLFAIEPTRERTVDDQDDD